MADEEEPKTEEDMKRELEDLQLQMNEKTDESLESTRRMLAMCEESKDAGIRTLVMLDEQGEQLDRIEEGMDTINKDMKDAEKNLEGMEKCCGLTKSIEKSGEFANAWNKNEDVKGNTEGPRVVVGETSMPGGGYVTKITNDAREEEMENNVAEVSGMIGNLRNMAVDMGNEIDSQNRQVSRINIKAASNKERIEQAAKRTAKLAN